MKKILEENGYVLNDINTWIKGSWTIRIDENYIEAFQDLSSPQNNNYIIWPKNIDSLIFILEEIEKL